jgi:hypothetical protein
LCEPPAKFSGIHFCRNARFHWRHNFVSRDVWLEAAAENSAAISRIKLCGDAGQSFDQLNALVDRLEAAP